MSWYLENRTLSEHDIRVMLLGSKMYQRFVYEQVERDGIVSAHAGSARRQARVREEMRMVHGVFNGA
ncbi:MAG: hypothetical protein AVDCRST_MAG93-7717 [uncultured Chloroflexia bacterium]|uniref:Uncharacterized protein n=1 Tax=uncultured Chloroflexia bacterium TaxID=1672391 RepID=A0A6J4MMG5_9CHLR|nr:MAG: hypothetical protein AVDCRST_MAG93-7717 [uncultured Chloroflexia bacterium]